MKLKYIWWVGAVATIVIVGGVWVATRDNAKTDTTNSNTTAEVEEDMTGYIVVEGGEGELGEGASTMSYVGESARGLEAYLAGDNDTVTYSVDVAEPGTYSLDIKLSDDGTWRNGDRSATVTINNTGTLKYDHVSEDTKGWKWYALGSITMKTGANEIKFTKVPGGYAAFVMDEFRLKPTLVETN